MSESVTVTESEVVVMKPALSVAMKTVAMKTVAMKTVAKSPVDYYPAVKRVIAINYGWRIVVPVWSGIIVTIRSRISVSGVRIGVKRYTDAYLEVNSAIRKSGTGRHQNENDRRDKAFHS